MMERPLERSLEVAPNPIPPQLDHPIDRASLRVSAALEAVIRMPLVMVVDMRDLGVRAHGAGLCVPHRFQDSKDTLQPGG